MFVLGMILVFSLINIEQEKWRAEVYLFMLVFTSGFVFLDFVLKRKEIIDTITEENRQTRFWILKNVNYKVMFIVFGVLSVLYVYKIASTGLALIDSPVLDVVPFAGTPIWLAFLSGLVGIVENYLFFGSVLPLINTNVSGNYDENSKNTLRKIIAAPIAIISTALIFAAYHWAVYGISNWVAFTSVITFGVIFGIVTLMFRSLVPSDLLHFSNNFGVTLFRHVSISPAALF